MWVNVNVTSRQATQKSPLLKTYLSIVSQMVSGASVANTVLASRMCDPINLHLVAGDSNAHRPLLSIHERRIRPSKRESWIIFIHKRDNNHPQYADLLYLYAVHYPK
jgi:hypothetical protein